MIIIFRDQPSESARALSTLLHAKRVMKPENIIRLAPGNVVVNWGSNLPPLSGPEKVLSPSHNLSKFDQVARLEAAGIETIKVSRTIPLERVQTLERPPFVLNGTPQLTEAAARELHAQLGVYLQTPPPSAPRSQWLARTADHVGGLDLLQGAQRVSFYTRKENFVKEYRVHSFLGRSIRAGEKVKRAEFDSLPLKSEWIRSWDGGWKISYDGTSIKQAHRDIAHRACSALGFDFGAVDIGQREDGTLVVLEVNRAPGIEGGTLEAYAGAIRKWAETGR